jgi:Carboxypeptidase regulatory-like domain
VSKYAALIFQNVRFSQQLPGLSQEEQSSMRWLKSTSWFVGALIMTTSVTWAQTTTGTITGRVVDTQGLPVPGVIVTVEGPNLRGATTAVTRDNGDYIVPLLPPGPYSVTFQLSGFTRQQKAVTVASTQTLPLNVTMDPAELTETVTVVGRSPVLTQTAQVATNFDQQLIAMLPTNRDINAIDSARRRSIQLARTAPIPSPAQCRSNRSSW